MPDFYEPDWEEFNPLGWDDSIAHLWDSVTAGQSWAGDDYAKQLFETAYIEDASPAVRAYAREALADWFHSSYGLDWDDQFDWESWREWYNAQ